MGSQFDSLAVQILPALFKVLVITVQVRMTACICRPELIPLYGGKMHANYLSPKYKGMPGAPP
jgi:hypothetical protein